MQSEAQQLSSSVLSPNTVAVENAVQGAQWHRGVSEALKGDICTLHGLDTLKKAKSYQWLPETGTRELPGDGAALHVDHNSYSVLYHADS